MIVMVLLMLVLPLLTSSCYSTFITLALVECFFFCNVGGYVLRYPQQHHNHNHRSYQQEQHRQPGTSTFRRPPPPQRRRCVDDNGNKKKYRSHYQFQEFPSLKAKRDNDDPSEFGSSSASLRRIGNHHQHGGVGGDRQVQHRDVVIIGGGLAGLSTAIYLSRIDPGRHITIFDKEEWIQQQSSKSSSNKKKSTVASFAAAGMLAPQSERLPQGPLLELCMESRRMYPEFCTMVESMAKESGDDGAPYLWKDDDTDDKDSNNPWSVGYVASGGFLAPAFAGDSVATWAPPVDGGKAIWLDSTQVHEMEPNLHPEVVGGWWFPEDASVDARRLTCTLRAACIGAGVQIRDGPDNAVTSLDLVDGMCRGLWLQDGRYVSVVTIVVANGAWMRYLLPVPIEPHKGQSLSLRMPSNRPPVLRRVLFAQDSYIVPKSDGRIVVGATVEAGSYDPNVTPAGMMHILTHAMQLIPAIKDLPIEETWVGLRPTTPDKGPIIGKTPWENLFLAGGYWRNGVLLAPKTGQLLASLITATSRSSGGSSSLPLSDHDRALLDAFAWDRFYSPEGGTKLSAQSRYAASMHPVHTRASGAGISASVGTELGSYSTARAAKEEREQDRKALFEAAGVAKAAAAKAADAVSSDGSGDDLLSDEEELDAFERAAAMGREDSKAFNYVFDGDDDDDDEGEEGIADSYDDKTASATDSFSSDESAQEATTPTTTTVTRTFEGSADAYTVSASSTSTTSNDDGDDYAAEMMGSVSEVSDIQAAYETIKRNKKAAAKAAAMASNDDDEQSTPTTLQDSDDERPDPGFRIYFVHPETGEKHEIPPYTKPGVVIDRVMNKKSNDDNKKEIEPKRKNQTASMPINGEGGAATGRNLGGVYNNDDDGHDDNAFVEAEEEEPGYSEEKYDGYQEILEANRCKTNEELLEVMRQARKQNRLGQDEIDYSKIGAQRPDDDEDDD